MMQERGPIWPGRIVLVAGMLFFAAAAPLLGEPDVNITYTRPDVAEQNGNIVYYDNVGAEHPLTTDSGYAQPALSPDGKTAAFIRIEKAGEPGYGDARSSLWIADIASAKTRLLLASTSADDPTENLAAMWHPLFSANGHKVYVMSEAWVTSSAIHEIDIKTAKHRYISEGELLGLIGYGKYKNWLMVRKRRYLPGPDYGTDHPIYVISANRRRQIMIPGSADDDGDPSVRYWMSKYEAYLQ